ncbi:DUF2142 domain-containing protein [Flaviflexus salsibiostraticola]|uniref:DUF2142 domain-containing protein n=1 Tax=Flaviflexus salsibiostraticola TaxID=1282737 RepID=A0A3Q8WUZ2_9ACTO|nr:DUF2142 domain-containing protein [Flaviflexus salsibiostraticola]AZN30867.1 DUF2142 domain-containing protein [Flaviflexus salsibiostraticola]
MGKRAFVASAALLTLLVLVVQAVWAVSLPGFRGPDEPHHVNSILRLASGGGWPSPGHARVGSSVIEAARESGTITSSAEGFSGLARTKLGNDRAEPRTEPPFPTYFRNRQVTPHEERSATGSVPRLDPSSSEIDQMSQHPPVYYAGGALVTDLFNLDQQPWDRMLLGLRLYGIVLTLPLIPSLIYTARKLGARRTWALAAGFLPFGIPQYFAITAGVTNDALAIGAGALVVAALVKAGTERIRPATVALVALSLGLALWSKGLLLAFGLALILVFALKRDETWRARIAAIAASGVGALVIGWWWIHNIIRFGVIQPSGFPREVPDGWDPSMAEFPTFLGVAWRSITTSFFSAFGWLESDFHPVLTTALMLALIGLLVWAGINAGEHRRTFLAIVSPALGTVPLLLAESWSAYTSYGTIAGVQGRYFYPFLAVLGAIVLGLRPLRGRAIVVVAAVNLAIGAYGFIFLLNSAYPGYPWIDFPRYALVAGVSEAVLTIILEILVAAYVAAFVLAAYVGVKESGLTLSAEDRALPWSGFARRRRPASDSVTIPEDSGRG